MSMSFGLGVGISQSQKLTPQMQQAIRLLAMSQIELEQEVQLKLDSNPLLERVEEEVEAVEISPELAFEDWSNNTWEQKGVEHGGDGFEEFGQDELSDSFDKLSQEALDDGATDSDWSEVYVSDPSDLDFGGQHPSEGEHEFLGATKSTIQDHIRWQMNFKHLSHRDNLIADYLIDAMDDRGYIRLSIDELYQNLALEASFYQWQEEISPAHIMAVLKSIQACSPTGVGARSLAECLRLQLDELTAECDPPFADEAYMVLSAIHHLESNNIKGLMQETELDMQEIKGAIALIKTLNPEPAIAFYREQNSVESSVDVPDVLVIALGDSKGKAKKKITAGEATAWQVMLNPDVLPNLQINTEYVSLIKKGDDSPDNVYIKEQLADARLFIRSIDERNQNLLKVASCIIHRQQAFCESGVQALLPLTLRDVATEIGLHESTVSRLTTNKSILTPQGLYPLKFFFSSGIESEEGDLSSTAVCAKIRELISSENPKKPFSDAYITTLLESQGMNISRRTVTKYRENMGILSSTLRRQKM